MTLDVLLLPCPLKLAVRAARASADGRPAMFELHCRMTVAASRPQSSFHAATPSSVVEWTLWKSFEDFQTFDAAMRAPRSSTFARMMVPVAFAPEHKVRVFFHKDQTGSFIEKRRKELDYYMQRILMLSDVCDFSGGNGSSVLAEFLHASLHVPCHTAVVSTSAGLSPLSTTSSVNSVAQGLRQLHVDLRRAYSPSTPEEDMEPRSRKQYKQEIEEALLSRRGENDLRLFKKRASTFRKENDSLVGATEFVAFLNQHFGIEFASWLLVRFARSLRSEEQRAALFSASGLRDEEELQARQTDKIRRNSLESSPLSEPRAAVHKRSKKEVLARVEKIAGGNADHVASFKQAARALGNNQMTTDAFVKFLNQTFGDRDAQRILKLVVEVVPTHLQSELSEAVRRP